jgi:hypothetical protein
MANQNIGLATPATQMLDVYNVQLMNPKGNQQSKGKRKYKGNKGKGDKKAMNNIENFRVEIFPMGKI